MTYRILSHLHSNYHGAGHDVGPSGDHWQALVVGLAAGTRREACGVLDGWRRRCEGGSWAMASAVSVAAVSSAISE
ncbi:hypothetical protein ACCO45_004406 [Purpureocillium lilacinum]|uniref:Uncharacterized protein n=1 Tax=Purpureocillium lilacinum TaxID=33203 RepID=A0ACC4E3S3_PURLI